MISRSPLTCHLACGTPGCVSELTKAPGDPDVAHTPEREAVRERPPRACVAGVLTMQPGPVPA